MGVTLKQIAELAGVSRGTVDRALYDRGRVNPDMAQKIKKIAKDLGYQPNRAGRALALSKNPIKIGIIIQSYETPFMKAVLHGVKDAGDEVEHLGGHVLLRKIKSVNPFELVKTMDELKLLGVSAIALVPTQDNNFCEKVNEFVSNYHIPIVTLNSDVEHTKRLCFVGQNSLQSGRTAAGLMGEISGGKGLISVISGPSTNPALKDRLIGFEQEMKTSFPDISLLPVAYSYDEEIIGKETAMYQLQKHPDITGIFVTSNGDSGVCDALRELNLDQKVKVICYDLTEDNVMNLKSGAINYLIGQNSYKQGYEPIMILFHLLLEDKQPSKEFIYTEIVIKSKYNL